MDRERTKRSHWHDYREKCIYLVTVSVKDRRPLLGSVMGDANKAWIRLSQEGRAVWSEIESLPKRYPQVRVLQHQIMPDHVHLVLYVTERLPEGLPLGNIIASWKAACSKACAALNSQSLRDLKAATHNDPTQEVPPNSAASGSSSEAAFRSHNPQIKKTPPNTNPTTMSTPLFSVLIANYNNGRYLMDAIDSVLRQTYTNWEIVLVDDGSTDNSQNIYESLAGDSRIHIFRNEENKGCGYTKRRCAELAKGEICGFLDADDCITPDAIEIMTNAHIQKPQCSLIYSTFYNADNHLNIISVSNHQCTIPDNKSFLTFNVPGAISHFATFKKDRYNQTQGINPLMLKAVDVDLYLKLEEKGELFFIPQPLYYYRTETGNNISLGRDNSIKATYWDFIARLNAYQRRNLPIENITYSTLSSLYKEAFSDGQDDIRNTCSYRTGKKIITPFRFLARIIK